MTSPTPVLLVGWRLGSARALAARGTTVTCLAAPEHLARARASGLVDQALPTPSPASVEDCLAALHRAGRTPRSFARVVSGSEYTLVAASVLGAGGRSPMPTETAVALRDKFVQKKLVRDAGVPVAGCRVVDDLDRFEPAGDVVIKPLAGAGARTTFRLRDDADLRDARDRLGPGPGLWLVEDHVSGHEHHVDGVVRDGVVTDLVVSRYLDNVIEIHAGAFVGSVALAPGRHPALYDRARDLTGRVLDALGHRDGVFHLEAFDQGDRLVFGEVGGRVSGGMVDRLVDLVCGLDLHGAWAEAALGRSREPASRVFGDVEHGQMFLPCPPGKLVEVPAEEDVRRRPGVVDLRLELAPGQTMRDMAAAADVRAGLALVAAPPGGSAAGRMRDLADWYRSRCVVR